MKILYLITGLGGGGAEKVVVDLADQMYLRGHQVKIAYLKGEIIVHPKSNVIELVYLSLEKINEIGKCYCLYKKLIEEFKPDIVHAHMVHANIFARLMRLFAPVPRLICTAHSNNEGGKLRMLAYQLTDSLSNLNTNVSKGAVQEFIEKKAFNHKALAVYNGIDLTKFSAQKYDHVWEYKKSLDIESDDILLLAVGRLNIAKDYSNILNALYFLNKKIDKKIKLLIAGEGEERGNIESLIVNLNLVDNVKLLGRRDDIPQLMLAADIFVLSSAFEGFGLVVAEAMACETFVVATDCGGVREVMGGHGLLVPPQNSQTLAKALQQAIFMSDREKNINNLNALNYVRTNFDLQKIVEKWIELYES